MSCKFINDPDLLHFTEIIQNLPNTHGISLVLELQRIIEDQPNSSIISPNKEERIFALIHWYVIMNLELFGFKFNKDDNYFNEQCKNLNTNEHTNNELIKKLKSYYNFPQIINDFKEKSSSQLKRKQLMESNKKCGLI